MAVQTNVIIFLLSISVCNSLDMYQKKFADDYANFTPTMEKPFRMQKLNIVWEKAMNKLPKEKLKLLFTDLKYQDKEEIALKKLKTEGLDKNGLQEALVRKSLNAILTKYDLDRDFRAVMDSEFEKRKTNFGFEDPLISEKPFFRDKKLAKLWWKAEQQGFSDEQLKMLKEEFLHHQDKVDEYYRLLQTANTAAWFKDEPKNSIEQFLSAEEGKKMWKTEENPHQLLREKHSELRAGYDYLSNQVFWRIKNKDFDEPLVNSLWEMALNGSFTPIELESLKGELHHFEHRIKKLKHLSDLHTSADDQNYVYGMDPYKRQKKLKEYHYKVDKIHRELTNRILGRHTEL